MPFFKNPKAFYFFFSDNLFFFWKFFNFFLEVFFLNLTVIFINSHCVFYGAPFVSCTLLSTEAILSRQKSKM